MLFSSIIFSSETKKRLLKNFNPLSLGSDENEISLYIVTTCSNIQVMRIKEVITKDNMSWFLDKFSLLVPYEMYEEQKGEYAFYIYWGLKG